MTPLQAIRNHGWADTIQKFGVAGLACLVLYWVGVSVLKPMADDALETQRVLRTEIPKQTEVSRQVLEILNRFSSESKADHKTAAEKLGEINDKLPSKPK